MKPIVRIVFVIITLNLLLPLLTAGMAFSISDEHSIPPPAKMRAIQDMLGREVVVPENLQRVALLGGPTGQVAFILGVQDRLCAVTNTLRMSQLARMLYPKVEDLPGPRTVAGNINIEELIESRPELVIAGDTDGQIVERKTRIPVAYLDSSMAAGIKELKDEIRFYAKVFQKEDRAEIFAAYLDNTIAFVRSRTSDIPIDKRKKVFNGYHANHLVTLGGDTFLQERIEAAGCLNAAAPVSTEGKQTGLHAGLGEVTMEQVLAWNPDILVINAGKPEDLYIDARWRAIKAIKTKQVFYQPTGIFIFNRPTAESAVLYPLWLAVMAYPERFQDISLVAEVKKFYKEVMQANLTDQQASDILKGAFEMKIMKGAVH